MSLVGRASGFGRVVAERESLWPRPRQAPRSRPAEVVISSPRPSCCAVRPPRVRSLPLLSTAPQRCSAGRYHPSPSRRLLRSRHVRRAMITIQSVGCIAPGDTYAPDYGYWPSYGLGWFGFDGRRHAFRRGFSHRIGNGPTTHLGRHGASRFGRGFAHAWGFTQWVRCSDQMSWAGEPTTPEGKKDGVTLAARLPASFAPILDRDGRRQGWRARRVRASRALAR